jgi:flagellar capping protein FliD
MAVSSISKLDSYYQNLINYNITQEKQAITRLAKQKDDINIKKAVYTDLSTKFNTLQTAVATLRNSDTGVTQANINSFISAFNDLTTYVRSKTTTVKNADDTYTRGSLIGEQNLRYTSNDLVSSMSQDFTNDGAYKNISEIGISLNSALSATITDASKLTSALATNPADVKKLLDGVMSALDTKIGTYTGTSGYINQSLTNANNQISYINGRTEALNVRISRRQDSLVKQYTQIQAQMQTLTSTFNMNSKIYG